MSQADWLGDRAQRHPNRVAVTDAASHRQHSYRGFDNRGNQIAHFCDQWVGLLPGDCIGLLSLPSDDVLQIVVAAGKLGLTALLLDPAASPDALIATINQLGPRTLFHGLAQADLVQEIWFEVDSVEQVIPLRGAVDTANFEDIVAHYPPILPSIDREGEVPWLHFAAEGITWADLEAVAAHTSPDDRPERVAAPIYRPTGWPRRYWPCKPVKAWLWNSIRWRSSNRRARSARLRNRRPGPSATCPPGARGCPTNFIDETTTVGAGPCACPNRDHHRRGDAFPE